MLVVTVSEIRDIPASPSFVHEQKMTFRLIHQPKTKFFGKSADKKQYDLIKMSFVLLKQSKMYCLSLFNRYNMV